MHDWKENIYLKNVIFPYICHWAVTMEYRTFKILNINLILETFISYNINRYSFSTLRKPHIWSFSDLIFLGKLKHCCVYVYVDWRMKENMFIIVPKVIPQYRYLHNIFFHFICLYAYLFVCMCKAWGSLCMYVCMVMYMTQLVFRSGKQARQIDVYTPRRVYCKDWKWNNFSVYIHTGKCRYTIFSILS